MSAPVTSFKKAPVHICSHEPIEVDQVRWGKITKVTAQEVWVEILPDRKGVIGLSDFEEWVNVQLVDMFDVGDTIWVAITAVSEPGEVTLSYTQAVRWTRSGCDYFTTLEPSEAKIRVAELLHTVGARWTPCSEPGNLLAMIGFLTKESEVHLYWFSLLFEAVNEAVGGVNFRGSLVNIIGWGGKGGILPASNSVNFGERISVAKADGLRMDIMYLLSPILEQLPR